MAVSSVALDFSQPLPQVETRLRAGMDCTLGRGTRKSWPIGLRREA